MYEAENGYEIRVHKVKPILGIWSVNSKPRVSLFTVNSDTKIFLCENVYGCVIQIELLVFVN